MRRPVLALLVLVSVLAALAGCGKHVDTFRNPVPPDTRLFVEGPVDTVNHVVHLYWFGTDPDGYIRGFEYRYFTSPAESAQTKWTFTRQTNLVFNFGDSTGYSAPVFEVRAVDSTAVAPPADAAPGAPGGLRDLSPARQSFQVWNQPPVVTLLSKFNPIDSTFASATVYWSVTDPDNDLSSVRFRVWLDGHQDDPDIVTGSSFTVPSARFFEADGHTLLTRPRQLFVQAIDDGGMAGNIDSTRWVVRAPASGGHAHYGRLLIVDDLPNANPWNSKADTLYANTAFRNLPAGTFSVLRLERPRWSNAFRTAKDLEQTCKLFDAVVWYIGGADTWNVLETTLQRCQDGIAAYLDGGGNFYVDGLNLLQAYHVSGVFTQEFAQSHLGIEACIERWDQFLQPQPDSTAGWSASGATGAYVRFSTDAGDTLVLRQPPTAGLRGIVVSDAAYGLAVGDPPVFAQPAPFPMVVGVSVPQALGGRMILNTFPFSYSLGPVGGSMDPDAPRILAHIYGLLGAAGP